VILYGAENSLREAAGIRVWPSKLDEIVTRRSSLRNDLGEPLYEALWGAGRNIATDPEQLAATALHGLDALAARSAAVPEVVSLEEVSRFRNLLSALQIVDRTVRQLRG
jgi:hypothetical protein